MTKKEKNGKVSYEEFTKLMINANKKQGKYKGLHVVYGGFNEAFRMYYGQDVDVRQVTSTLHKEGKIVILPAKGGAMLYLPEDLPNKGSKAALSLLDEAGIKVKLQTDLSK